MHRNNMVDTFPAFLKFWKKAQKAPLVIQIEMWATEYMAEWAELLDKQLADYASRQEDWEKAASEKIFPSISTRLPAMEVAHRNIILLYPFLCN